MKASLSSYPEGAKKCQEFKKIDTEESTLSTLYARGLEILATLSGIRIPVASIKFTGKTPQDSGTFADVAMATLVLGGHCGPRARKVAAKRLRFIDSMTEEKFCCAFVNELLILAQLSHPNIVEIIGFVEDMETRTAWLVLPWEDNGNLRRFLHSGAWEIPERVSLIHDVAVGLEYLHTRRPPICHGDLKSLNILVNSSNRALITDFGSARIVEPGATSAHHPFASEDHPSKRKEHTEIGLAVSDTSLGLTGPACSTRWASPEYLNGDPLGLESDIWALGWVAWEVSLLVRMQKPGGAWKSSFQLGEQPSAADKIPAPQRGRDSPMRQKC